MADHILVLEDMIADFDKKPPKQGRETTAFIKRWRKEELALEHTSPTHLNKAIHGINHAEIESIRVSKEGRDDPRDDNNQLIRLAGSRRVH